ncbi:serine protein kinase [Candidatus Azambacteria bacterium RIFCSPHIGHO2_01_FULL_40_24]|uniref:Serine protein kinase n=1 Tax=Candidatus Azambacteria bacterium RIFCSPHIGHO2_01_FULL_40_24 TaxID=1797301 RepID=A0A1F5B452_9BACT|nr:MAG: serine protein kinase [Candidatus Azambacteria bacterium RIFCSPHIGHO2_01_FULL_40_24]
MLQSQEWESLAYHLKEVSAGKRRFENAAQSVSRMILEKKIEKRIHAGKTVYDFEFFREGAGHIVSWYDEINDFVHFVKDAAQGGSAKEMAYVLVGEPGNGKTTFVEFVCKKYREFLSRPENRKYTFKFVNLDQALDYDKKVATMHSLTFEDPMILVMNLFESADENKKFFTDHGFSDKAIEELYRQKRPLGASTEYLWHELLERFGGDVMKIINEHIRVIQVPMSESSGTTTGKYAAKDKITSSSVDLLGEESLQHLLLLKLGDPNKFDLRRGALARVAGGGIHFSDEIFKNKIDLVQIYLGVIQNRRIEIDGFLWPIDTLIIATSNNWEYNRFVSEKEQSPIKDRCRICYVSHNTDYKLQQELTAYAFGSQKRTTILGEPMHEDPNLNYAVSVGVILSRLLHSEKLTPIETMKLEAGEIAGEKGVKTLIEVKETANANPDVTKRWGQKGLGHRDLGRALQVLGAMHESNEGKCLFAKDVFKALERVCLDYVTEATDRDKYKRDLEQARKIYREQVKTAIFNAYRDDPDAVTKDVMRYVNMIIGVDAENLGPDKMWRYKDPQTGEIKSIKIDEKYINSVEERLGMNNNEKRESFRNTIRKVYGQKISIEPNYGFMDNQELVKAVTDVRLQSDVAGAGSLIGALANRTNEENVKIYNRMIDTMLHKLGFCLTCAQKTIEYFCTKEDES